MNQNPEEAQAAEWAAVLAISRRMAAIVKAPRYAASSFDNYRPTTIKQAAALAAARKFYSLAPWMESENAANLLLLGRPGTGKTHLACAVLRADIEVDARSGLDEFWDHGFVGHADLLREWHATPRGKLQSLVDRYRKPSILVLDDVRGGRAADEVEALEAIVEARYRQGDRPVILTTNLNLPMLREALGDRSFDRLREGAILATLDGASHRARHEWRGPPNVLADDA